MKKFSQGKPYKVVALCMTKFKDYDQVMLIQEMCQRCAENNIKVVIFSSLTDLYSGGINDIGEARIFSLLNPEQYDAIVLMSETLKNSEVLSDIIKSAKKVGTPVISVDRELKDCINVGFSYSKTFEKIVRHIVEYHKVTDCYFMSGFRGNAFSNERKDCFIKVMNENGVKVTPNMIMYGNFWSDPTRLEMERLLNSKGHVPRAIICANDIMAIECMRVLKRYGYRVPEDVMVTGFDGIDLEQFYSPRLTTAEFDKEALVDTIVQAINNPDASDHYTVEYVFRIGGSCGCKEMNATNVEECLYIEKFRIDDREEFIQSMYNMIAQMCSFPELHYIFKRVPQYLKRTKQYETWMCFNNDFLDENDDISFYYNKEEHYLSRYSEVMRVPMHCVGEKFIKEGEIRTEQLIPDFDKVIEKNGFIMMIPIHVQGFTTGYVATTFDVWDFMYSYFQTFLLDFRHVMEIYINRANMERLYIIDNLTKTYNRTGFHKNIGLEMKKSMREQIPFVIVSADMDHLKFINDTYGHAEGDFAIKTFANHLLSALKGDEICSRFGGDEFVIAFCEDGGEERAREIIETISDNLISYNLLSEKTYAIEASFGYFAKIVEKEDTLDEFIIAADKSMYVEKKKHKKKESEDGLLN